MSWNGESESSIAKSGISGLQPLGMDGVRRSSQGYLEYTDRPQTLVEMLRSSVDRFGQEEALVELGADRVTYQQLWDAAAAVAGGLRAQGIARGDRVAITYRNGISWVVAFFGIQFAGAVVVPINTRFAPPEVDYVLKNCGARMVLGESTQLPSGAPYVDSSGDRDSLVGLFYTSGTTGFPKGAMTSNQNMLSTSETFRRQIGRPKQGVRNLISVPLFHVTGCHCQLIPTLEMGGSAVILPNFSVPAMMNALRAESINVLVAVPSIYWLLTQRPEFAELDVSGVRSVVYGGAPIAPELVRHISHAFPTASLINGYGLTETSATSTSLPHQHSRSRPESVGLAVPVVELDLIPVEGGAGVGELIIRGENVTRGYWGNADATAAAFEDGWFRTGDLAKIDNDGFVILVDRIKDMINRGGENVYCIEVENALAEHPAIFECAVVGVPDPMLGEAVGVILVPRPGAAVDPNEIRAFLAERVADFKVPEYVATQDGPLARNPGGKLLKSALRDGISWGARHKS